MPKRTCSIDGCDRVHRCRGWCDLHYSRWKRHGDPLTLLQLPHVDTECSIEGCTSLVTSRGWCDRHYRRWERHGDPLGGGTFRGKYDSDVCAVDGCGLPRRLHGLCSKHNWRMKNRGDVHYEPFSAVKIPPEDRFMAKVDEVVAPSSHRPELGPCWIWMGYKTPGGYGLFGPATKQRVYTHRWAYEFFVGPIPAGYDIDHLCRVRACCNPDHLEAVTRQVNLRRGRAARGLGQRPPRDRRQDVSRHERKRILARDGYRCFHCGGEGDASGYGGQPWHIDHLHPIALGGTKDPDNLVVSCLPCNNRRTAWIIQTPIKPAASVA